MARDNSARNTRAYRLNRADVLAKSDLCHLCGHGGATTCDHVVGLDQWPRDLYGTLLPGHDDIGNLAPAHGSTNRCPVCGLACNQTKAKRSRVVRQTYSSRIW